MMKTPSFRPTPTKLSLALGDSLHGPSTPSTCFPGSPFDGISAPSTCSSRRSLFRSSSSPCFSQVSYCSDLVYEVLEETASRMAQHNTGQHKLVASIFLRIASMLPAEDKARLSISCKLFQEHLDSYQWWSVDEAAIPNIEWVRKGGATLRARLERLSKLEHGCRTWDKESNTMNVNFSQDGRTASRIVSTDRYYAVVASAEPMRSFNTECFSTQGGRYSRYCEFRMGTILKRFVGSLVVGITWKSPDSIGQSRLPDARKLKECCLTQCNYSTLKDGTLGVFLAPNGDILVFNNGLLLSREKINERDKAQMNMASEFWLVLEVPAFTVTLSEVNHLSSEIIAAAFPEEKADTEGDEAGSDGLAYVSV